MMVEDLERLEEPFSEYFELLDNSYELDSGALRTSDPLRPNEKNHIKQIVEEYLDTDNVNLVEHEKNVENYVYRVHL